MASPMSAAMYGADADELDRLAQQFTATASEIDAAGHGLSGVLNRVSWLGDIASDFIGDWTGRCLPKIGLSTEFLRRAAIELHRQAKEQRTASTGGVAAGPQKPGPGPGPRPPVDLDRLERETEDLIGKSPAEQLEWWNGLSPAEQQALLKNSPGVLMYLPGLPSDVLTQAQDNYMAQIEGQVVVSTAEGEIHGSVGVWKFVYVGKGLGAGMTTHKDGSVDVEMSGESLVGAGVPGASMDLGLGDSITYHFSSKEEALKYLAVMGGALAVATVTGPAGNYAVQKILEQYSDHYQGSTQRVDVDARATDGQLTGTASGQVAVTSNRDGTTTVSTGFALTGSSAAASAGLIGAANTMLSNGGVQIGKQNTGGVAGSASLSFGADGRPETVTLKTGISKGEATGLFGIESANIGSGTNSTTTIELRLDDPVIAKYRNEIVSAVQRGDGAAVLATLQRAGASNELLNRATVTHSTFDTSSGELGIDAIVASAGGSFDFQNATSVSVKPPGGTLQQVNP